MISERKLFQTTGNVYSQIPRVVHYGVKALRFMQKQRSHLFGYAISDLEGKKARRKDGHAQKKGEKLKFVAVRTYFYALGAFLGTSCIYHFLYFFK
jgi:hypothetical protein